MSITIPSATSSAFTPGLTPPPGVTPDPTAYNELYPYIILAEVVCVGLTTILLIVRCLVRTQLMRQWGLEDWGSVLSWLLFLGYSSVLAAGYMYGAGQHQWDLTPYQVKQVLYLNNVVEIEYGFAILSTKLTLLYIQQRIFAPTRFTRRWNFIAVVMILNTMFYMGLTFAKIFLCTPRPYIWDKSLDGKCGSLFGALIASGTWNSASDIVILVMPLVYVWQLKLTRDRRLALVGVFVIGVIAPIFSIIGVAMRVHLVKDTDVTYAEWRVLLYAYAELTAGFVCISLPIMPRLYKWVRGDRGTSEAWHSGGGGGGGGTPGAPDTPKGLSGSRHNNGRRSLFKVGIQGLADRDLLTTTTNTYFELGEGRDGADSTRRLGKDSDSDNDQAQTATAPSSNATDAGNGGKEVATGQGAGGAILKTTAITIERHEAGRTPAGFGGLRSQGDSSRAFPASIAQKI